MDADNNRAFAAIEIYTADRALQYRYFDLMLSLQNRFEEMAGKDFDFSKSYISETGKEISRIWIELNGINIFRENQWPDMISFLKKNIISLDRFWTEYKDVFDMTV